MLDNLTTKQKKIVGVIGLIIILGVSYMVYKKTSEKENVDLDNNILISNNSQVENTTNSEETEKNIIIHITGAVKKPGIVKIKEGGRIEDAIEQAGGLTEDADISKVNLAYILDDGLKINIPSILEESNEEEIIVEDSGESIIEDNNTQVNNQEFININKATQTDLENLPGIGPSLAMKIIEYRDTNGNFTDISELKNVNGIGESKFNTIKDFIRIK